VVNGPLKAGLTDKAWISNIARLAERDLELDINGPPEVLPDVARLAGRVPELRIVINHAANLRIDGKAPPRGWLTDIDAAAKHANVFMKVSGLVEGVQAAGVKAPSDVEFYRPALDALWQAFGEDRLIYGSNWPVSERFADYGVVQGIVHEYFQQHGEKALRKFFRLNALAAYKTPRGK
jgi:predicted TIM-barrel fold metal-dependent hydrolase